MGARQRTLYPGNVSMLSLLPAGRVHPGAAAARRHSKTTGGFTMRLRPWIKFPLVGLAALLAAGAAAFAFAVHRGDAKRERTVSLPDHPIALRDDAAALARGRYLFESRGCAECHGHD